MKSILTTQEWELKVGEQFRTVRLRKNLSQSDAAKQAGVSLNALRSLEAGTGARVATLISVARALGKHDWLESLQPELTVSPLQMLKANKTRLRASREIKTGSKAAAT